MTAHVERLSAKPRYTTAPFLRLSPGRPSGHAESRRVAADLFAVRPTLNHSGWIIRDGDDRHMSGVRPSR
jgi:hypothetical protein